VGSDGLAVLVQRRIGDAEAVGDRQELLRIARRLLLQEGAVVARVRLAIQTV
jgi:hypothetical protein